MGVMTRTITQRELRNQSGEIMRGLDRGESYIVTRNGVPVGELTPYPKKRFRSTAELKEMFADAPRIDYARLRADLDAHVDQTPPAAG